MSPRHASPLTLEHVLLAMMDQKPMHGYELYQEIRQMNGIAQIWHIKQALLYAILEKLEAKKYITAHLVEGESYPPRKYYQLTDHGRASLHNWLKTPVKGARDMRQEFLAKMIVSHRFAEANLKEIIAIQTRACENWLIDIQSMMPPKDADHIDEWMVYSFRLNWIESVLSWLKMLEAEMASQANAGAGQGI